MQRPSRVDLALWLLWGSLAIGVVDYVISIYDMANEIGATGMLYAIVSGMALLILLCAWLNLKIGQGRNWARVVTLVFSVASLALVVFDNNAPSWQTDLEAVVTWVLMLSDAVALYLLFTGSSKAWFRRQRDFAATAA